MPAIITVAYPRPSGEVKFDLKYYLDVHMPLVHKTWASKGLKSWTVTEHKNAAHPAEQAIEVMVYICNADDSEGPYVIQAILTWDTVDQFDAAAAGEDGAEVFADIVNFTDIKPIPIKGEVKGSWSA